MVQRGGGARLAQEELRRRRVVAQVVGQALQRDDAAEAPVARLEDDAHAAAADLLEDLVALGGDVGRSRRGRLQLSKAAVRSGAESFLRSASIRLATFG